MRNIIRNILIIFSLLLLAGNSIYSQNFNTPNPEIPVYPRFHLNNNYLHKTQGASNAIIFTGAMVIMFATPTLVYKNKKAYFGLSRELSLVFGKTGELRVSAEYSFIFRRLPKHHFRAVLKYDILSKLNKTEWIFERDLISIGAGYFVDAEGSGIFPEVSAGFRMGGEGGYYFYPYIKLPHTFMTKKDKPDNTDFSLGIAVGFEPFFE